MAIQLAQSLKRKTGQLVHRFFVWGASISSPDILRKDDDGGPGTLWRTRAPYYFPDVDTLEILLTTLTRIGAVHVQGAGPSVSVTSENSFDVAQEIARSPLPQRASLAIGIHPEGSLETINVYFLQSAKDETKARTLIRVEHSTKETLETVAYTVASIASVLPRRLRKPQVPLIEPITAKEETQARREREITKLARRSGAVSGVVTSLVVALITLAFPELLKHL